jgi:hypothetical protein
MGLQLYRSDLLVAALSSRRNRAAQVSDGAVLWLAARVLF